MRADRRASATVCAATFLAVRQYRKWCVSISCLCGRFRVYISAVRQYRKRCVSISPLCGRLLVSWIPRESPCSRAGFPDFDNPPKTNNFPLHSVLYGVRFQLGRLPGYILVFGSLWIEQQYQRSCKCAIFSCNSIANGGTRFPPSATVCEFFFRPFDSIANGVCRHSRLCGRLRVDISCRSTVSQTVRVDTRASAAICELLIPVMRQYRKRCGSTDAPLRPFATPWERIEFCMVIYRCRN